jgi:hypothetical protein
MSIFDRKHRQPSIAIVDSKVYVGFVKNNKDVQRMGRLEVYVPELSTDPDDDTQWIVASYASPFAGASDPSKLVAGSQQQEGTQTSYGFWMIPPDLNNEVLVLFINGDPGKCVWFACLYQQNMNHMVPGVASDISFTEGENKVLPPVAEYNKADPAINAQKPIRPRFEDLHQGFVDQGLYSDFERGPSSSSARREAASKVFGFNTPRANCVYVDDDPTNEFIRLRTRSGTQILVHETNGYVYINSGSGNSWIEVSDDGIDVYSKGSISMRAEQDFNVRADRNINLDAGVDVNISAGNNINDYAAVDHNTKAGKNINELAGADINNKAIAKHNTEAATINRKSSSAIRDQSAAIHMKSSGSFNQQAGTINQKASAINRDGAIKDNGGSASAAASADSAVDALQTKTIAQADVPSGQIDSIVSRMPTHEPFALHPKSKNLRPPNGDVSSDNGEILSGGGAIGSYPPNASNTTSATPTRTQRTGDGDSTEVPVDTEGFKSKRVNVGNFKPTETVIAAIKRASDMTGVDFGYMMAMAEKESGFNPNAKAKTSSASGLYQMINSTWAAMVEKYGAKYNVTIGQVFDPQANALMAALFTRDNKAYLQRRGIANPSNTALYIAHFLGPGGSVPMLKGAPDGSAVETAGAKAASANKSIFYNGSSERTNRQVIEFFASHIEPKSVAYAGVTIPKSNNTA